jgi:hypothetical protein
MALRIIRRYSQKTSNKEALDSLKPPGIVQRLYNRVHEKINTAEKERKELPENQQRKINPWIHKKAMDFFDPVHQKQRTDKLVNSAFERGYYEDVREILQKGAKLWEAPDRLVPKKLSCMIPDLKGKLMDGKEVTLRQFAGNNDVSLIGLYFNAFGEVQF